MPKPGSGRHQPKTASASNHESISMRIYPGLRQGSFAAFYSTVPEHGLNEAGASFGGRPCLCVSLPPATATAIGVVVLRQNPTLVELLGLGLVISRVALHRAEAR